MKRPRQNGFALVLVVVAIVVVGLEMFVLAGGANTMLFQANTAYLQACERNLVASGLAWARRNIEGEETFDKTVELDVTALSIRAEGATLSVTVDTPRDKELQVRINTSCSRSRLTLRHNEQYRIPHKDGIVSRD
jgi:hypothetical protein